MNLWKPAIIVFISFSCNVNNGNPGLGTSQSNGEIQIHVYATGDNGFGYYIAVGGKKIITQPHIPAVPSVVPFASKEDAYHTALLVKQKMEHLISPPAVSVKELDSMHIRY